MTAAALTRFDLHRMKAAELPAVSGQLPKILSRAIERVPRLFQRKGPTWKIKTLNGNSAAAALRFHHKGPLETRKARDQRYHTDSEILKTLITRLNVNPKHKDFSWLQIRWTPIEDLCDVTGFARSTVTASLSRLSRAGLLRTKRRKNEARDREWVAVRWLTPALFDMLGLLPWMKRQKEGNFLKKKPRTLGTGPEPAPALDAVDAPEWAKEKLNRARRAGHNRGQPPPGSEPSPGREKK